MMFSVMYRLPRTGEEGVKDSYDVNRVHDSVLSGYLRDLQTNGCFIVSVIPLFKKRMHSLSEFRTDEEREKVMNELEALTSRNYYENREFYDGEKGQETES